MADFRELLPPRIRTLNVNAYLATAGVIGVLLLGAFFFIDFRPSKPEDDGRLVMAEPDAVSKRRPPETLSYAYLQKPTVEEKPQVIPRGLPPPSFQTPSFSPPKQTQVVQHPPQPPKRVSIGFVQVADNGQPGQGLTLPQGTPGGSAGSKVSGMQQELPEYARQGLSPQKRDFLDRNAMARAVVGSPLQPSPSDLYLKTGTMLYAQVINGVTTDQPGTIVATVNYDVRDSLTGKCVLIPATSTLVGTTNDMVAYGQTRGQAAWQRIEFPDGSYQDIGSMPATDAIGKAGFDGRVNHHYAQLTFAILGAGAISAMETLPQTLQNSNGSNGQVNVYASGAAGSTRAASEAANEMVRRELDRQNEITLDPGDDITLMLMRILPLPARGECDA